MWGGRFAGGPSAIMREINASIPFDKALWRQDIAASKAHVAMLAAQGIVSTDDAAAITGGLDAIAAEYEANSVPENWDLEDIHMTTESRLADLIGAAAGRLHTARSRNDRLLGLHRNLFVEANPIPVKWALAKMGLIENELRLPMVPLSPQHCDTVRAALGEAGCI